MWTPTSWQTKTVEQQAEYPIQAELDDVISELSELPPLVSAQEVLKLRQLTAQAAKGEVFLLQGGDCAESFADCHQSSISRKLQLMQQMSLLLMYGLGRPVVRVGRMAGQYAKPRSAHSETIDGTSLPSYRGDLINSAEFCAVKRQPDPSRLLKGYSLASLTLNFIRTTSPEVFQTLCQAQQWNSRQILGDQPSTFADTLDDVQKSFQLMHQLSPSHWQPLQEFYTCHEALHLHYEQALTRNIDDQWFNLSTHMPWVGMRTAKPDSAHIEYLRGIENPIAIKIGPRMTERWLCSIIEQLNPDNAPGKITLITRLGHQQVADKLPELIQLIQRKNYAVTWCCDPMHGNTQIAQNGIKTRHFSHISSELQQTVSLHQQHDSVLGGVHLELTGESVTECVGGHCAIQEKDLKTGYTSLVDPRLNPAQAIELSLNLMKAFENQGVTQGFPSVKNS